jgi:hypothetical protein
MPQTAPKLADLIEIIGNPAEIDERHGGAFDRGRADDYYGRGADPHKFAGPVVYAEGNSEIKDEIVDYAGTDVDNAVYFDGSCREGYIAINMRLYGILKEPATR